MAIFRAVENRRSMLRVANTGITGIILPSGEVVSRTGLFTRETLSGEVPLVSELTFYTRYGDFFAYACVLISALILVSASLKKRSNL
jgi:apolipoprotein N-acyltransferase